MMNWEVIIFRFPHLHIHNCHRGSSSFGRAIAFQAIGGEFEPRLPLFSVRSLTSEQGPEPTTGPCRCSSVVEHFLGKEEVKGSIPFNGSSITGVYASYLYGKKQ